MMKREPDITAEQKYEAVLESFGAVLRRTIVRLCPRDLGIVFDDIEQEARIKLWQALESEREIHDYASYLYRIAATVTIDAIRRVKSRREEQLMLADENSSDELTQHSALNIATESSPEDATGTKEVFDAVQAVLDRLPQNRTNAVALYLRGMTSDEIGNLLGWSEPKSRNLIYRGLKDLRKELAKAGIEYPN